MKINLSVKKTLIVDEVYIREYFQKLNGNTPDTNGLVDYITETYNIHDFVFDSIIHFNNKDQKILEKLYNDYLAND